MALKVILADNAGFCFGVKRAIEIAKKGSGKKKILGQLVHNKQVLDELEQQGIGMADNLDSVLKEKPDYTLIISAHGASDETYDALREKNIRFIDAACPLVKKVHVIGKDMLKKGYQVVIVGDRKHAEVEALNKSIKDSIVIENQGQAKGLSVFDKLAVISQTTQTEYNFNAVVDELKKHSEDLIIRNTICEPTKKRQESAEELAGKVDIMIVIGGKNSANTLRLTKICEELVETKQIETVSDLKREWFSDKKVVGVTAGASTPDVVIKGVVKAISSY